MNDFSNLVAKSSLSEEEFCDIFQGKEKILDFIKAAENNLVHYSGQHSIEGDSRIFPAKLSYVTGTGRYGHARVLNAKLQHTDKLVDYDCLYMYANSDEVIADISSIGREAFDALPRDACIGYEFSGNFYFRVTKGEVTTLINGDERIWL